MKNAAFVRCLQGVGNLAGQPYSLVHALQRLTLESADVMASIA